MRVLHLIQELSTGGAERVVSSLAAGLQARGHEVCVVAGRSGAVEVRPPDVEIPYIARRPARMVPAIVALRRTLSSWRPDVVHAHNPTMGLVASAATLMGRRPPALVTVHGIAEQDLRRGAALVRLSRLPVIACGPGVEVSLREQRVPVLRTVVNGISAAPPALERAPLMESLGLDARLRLVACVGRLAPVKNQQLLVRAMASVPDAALVLAGDGAQREELRALAVQGGVAERVRLVGDRADARALMAAADTVAMPSRSEGLPLVALEALAAGRPLVATAVRGIRELLHDGVDALLVPGDDAAAMAAALRRVLDDPALAAALGAAGVREAAAYTEEAMVSAYEGIYRQLAGR